MGLLFDFFAPAKQEQATPAAQALSGFERMAGGPAAVNALERGYFKPAAMQHFDRYFAVGIGLAQPWYVWSETATTGAAATVQGRKLLRSLAGGKAGRGLPASLPVLVGRKLYVGWAGGMVGPL